MSLDDDRAAAWAAVHDPATDAATLAAIAQAHPEFADAVARHPKCYPELRAWLDQYAAPEAPPSSEPDTASAAEGMPVGKVADPAAGGAAPTAGVGILERVRGLGTRRLAVIGGVAAAVLVVGGVGLAAAVAQSGSSAAAPEPTAERDVAPEPAVPTPSQAPTPTEEPPQTEVLGIGISTVSGLIAEQDEYAIGPSSVISAHGDGAQSDTLRQFSMVSIPAAGPLIETVGTIRPSTPTGTLTSAVYGVQSDTEAAPGFVVAVIDEIPAAGAQPHDSVVTVFQYDEGADTPSASSAIWHDFDGTLDAVWLSGDTVVLASTDGEYDHHLAGIRVATGEVVWQREADVEAFVVRDGVVTAAIGEWGGSLGRVEGDLVGLDAAGGQTLWTLAAAGVEYWAFEQNLGSGYVAVSTGAHQTDGSLTVIESATGRVVDRVDGYDARVVYDAPTARFVAVGAMNEENQYGLEVFDASGTVSFSISPADYLALGSPHLIGATGGVVWINGVDGLDLFDEATGEQDELVTRAVAASSSVFPLWSDGQVSLLTTPAGSIVLIHQNQDFTADLAVSAASLPLREPAG